MSEEGSGREACSKVIVDAEVIPTTGLEPSRATDAMEKREMRGFTSIGVAFVEEFEECRVTVPSDSQYVMKYLPDRRLSES